jgi:ABC-type Mn2+/Zn2+ transport systems, permease components
MRKFKSLLLFLPLLALALQLGSCGNRGPKVLNSEFNAQMYADFPNPDGNGIKSVTYTSSSAGTVAPATVEFDPYGRLVSYSRTDGSYEMKISYSPSGVPSFEMPGNPKVDFKVDNSSNIYEVVGLYPGEENSGWKTEYTFDKSGNVLTSQTGEPGGESCTYNIDYEYGGNGRIAKKTETDLDVSCVTYFDENGIPVRKISQDGEAAPEEVTFEAETDDQGNWTKLTAKKEVKGKKRKKRSRIESVVEREITYYDQPYSAAALASGMILVPADSTGEFVDLVAPAKASAGGIGGWFEDMKYRIKIAPYLLDTHSTVMFIVFIILAIAGAAVAIWRLLVYIDDEDINPAGEVTSKGMRRTWVYNFNPYLGAFLLGLCLLAGIVASIAVLLAVGGVFWLLMWILKILLIVLVWVGYISAILGALALFGKEGVGCLPLIIGIIIIAAEDWCKRTGEWLVECGNEFMESANFFGFGIGLFANYWDVMLLILFTPLVIFAAIAVILIVFNLLLRAFEWVYTKIYSINRPCPECGQHADYDYIIDGEVHPVRLLPGIYGSFHQTRYDMFDNPEYRVPTMILNGRERLTRRCRHCGAIIGENYDSAHSVGTDVHIGVVGHVGAGKSYLLYTGLNQLIQNADGKAEQIGNPDRNFDIAVKSGQISRGLDIQTDRRSAYRAIQVMVERSFSPVPYHLHFYDVAGEQFTTNVSLGDDALRFYRNVESIVMLIDPSMVDLEAPGIRADSKFAEWQKANNHTGRRYNPSDTLAALDVYLEKTGNSAKKIDLTFVCVKSDLGYFKAMGYPASPDAEQIRRFLKNVLGMNTLVNTGDSYRSVSFFATSVNDSESVDNLFRHLLGQRKVKL